MHTSVTLEGRRFSRSISTSDFNDIKNSNSQNDISSIWGRIADWICGTKKEEAKKLLFEIYKSTGEKSNAAFNSLRNLCGDGHKGNFTKEIKDGIVKFKIIENEIAGKEILEVLNISKNAGDFNQSHLTDTLTFNELDLLKKMLDLPISNDFIKKDKEEYSAKKFPDIFKKNFSAEARDIYRPNSSKIQDIVLVTDNNTKLENEEVTTSKTFELVRNTEGECENSVTKKSITLTNDHIDLLKVLNTGSFSISSQFSKIGYEKIDGIIEFKMIHPLIYYLMKNYSHDDPCEENREIYSAQNNVCAKDIIDSYNSYNNKKPAIDYILQSIFSEFNTLHIATLSESRNHLATDIVT